MSDDIWESDDAQAGDGGRPAGPLESRMDEFDGDDFGGPLFGDTAEQPATTPPAPTPYEQATAQTPPESEPELGTGGEPLSFGGDDSGALPHWTEAPTGDVPRIDPAPTGGADPTDDLDVWSSFSGDAPVWKEGDEVDHPSGGVPTTAPPVDPTGELTWEDASPESGAAGSDAVDADVDATTAVSMGGVGTDDPIADVAAPREPARITIGTDPSGMPRRPETTGRGAIKQRPPGSTPPAATGGDRNLPVAIAVGLGLAAVFLVLVMWRPAGAIAFVTVALGLASIEYFSKVTEKGYRPVVAAGVAACVAAPITAYWVGERMYPIVLSFCFIAGAAGFIGANSIEVGPMPNMAITMLGVVWIGMLGSFAALIIRYSNFFGGDNPIGTDTIVLLAVGVVANDVGAYFAGSAFGQTPLRAWISPNKSIEGFLGGTVLTLVVMVIIGMQDLSDTWSSTSHLLMLGIVISAMAPLGDLTESMFKRNLDVKDFGSIIKGHGGVLDRFDGFLFALPAVYYLMLVIEPWTAS
ncbi:MAG: phosphatidate cytidylyltransferase [Acidimicrobiia bacterium]|nr:phosphatidate cytidylyltransferase [Acidimicrobiia bacterium]